MRNLSQNIIECVREHKENATPAELLMMQKLRFRGIRFEFNYPVLTEKSFFTADFFLPKYGLIIELDGGIHSLEENQKKDIIKDIVYESLGYHVLRMWNSEVDTFDTIKVKEYRKGRIRLYEAPAKVPNYKKERGKKRSKIIKSKRS